MRSLCFALLFAASPVLAPGALAQTAVDAVRAFYTDPPFDMFEPANWDQLTGPALATMKKNAAGEDGSCVDFMPVVDGQDYDAAEIIRTLKLTDKGGGSVRAEFKLFGEDRKLDWTMEEVDGTWKVADIASQTGEWTLGALCSD